MNDFNFSQLTRRRFFSELGAVGFLSFSATPLFASPVGFAATQNETAATESAQNLPEPPNPAIQYPGVWSFDLPKNAIILVSDEQLEALQNPDQEINLSLSETPRMTTLRKICEETKQRNAKTLIVAFDEFWSQYRPGQNGKPRELYPDTDRYIEYIAKISRFAADYGIGLELSLLSPLELGKSLSENQKETGRWVQYREGYRDPETGFFSVSLWQHRRWTNNKGSIYLNQNGVRVFAFKESGRVPETPFYAVDPNQIVELQGPFSIERNEKLISENPSMIRVTISSPDGENPLPSEKFDRVMVVFSYQTPEIDYFSPNAKPFLENLVRKYKNAGIELNALYSDEIHIQQDWGYFSHHDAGQLTTRYLSQNFIDRFAETYGEQFRDFEKYLVYFLYGQHDFLSSIETRIPAQHIWGTDDVGVQSTQLFRRRYFDFLHRQVVDLFAGAKKFAESVYEKSLEARAHATWAQSPTIDAWNSSEQTRKYEYTPDFLWSNTVHQAAAACDDYFRWNDFLTGGGNDHAEGGWSDRDYYGEAIACSTGSLNDWPNAYAASWGAPNPVLTRHSAIQSVFGAAASPPMKAIENAEHREIEVLMLYPISLVSAEERFGSWMAQYGYANYITAEKLLQYGTVEADGTVSVRGRKYRTICALFEPNPPAGLLPFLEEFVERGGRLVWSGPPVKLDFDGNVVWDRWRKMFGLGKPGFGLTGLSVPGRRIEFEGSFGDVEAQTILTDFLVDQIYPFELDETVSGDWETVARCNGAIVGVRRGNVVYLGFRPRDDQAASLGYETRVWFDVLTKIGSYPPGRIQNSIPIDPAESERSATNDNPTVVSRTTPYLATRFPNGTIAIAVHYSRHKESWGGGFHRDAKSDEAAIAANPLPSDVLSLEKFKVGGREIDFNGTLLTAFRWENDRLVAFFGNNCSEIRIDGVLCSFADQKMGEIGWAPVARERRVPGGAILEIWTGGKANVRIPVAEPVESVRLFVRGSVGKCGQEIPVRFNDGFIEFESPANGASFYLIS